MRRRKFLYLLVSLRNVREIVLVNFRTAAEAAEAAENQQILKDAQIDVQIHVPLTGVAKRMVQTIKGTPAAGGNQGNYNQG